MLSNWISDLRYAARRLRTRPAYAFLAVFTLALGVGGTAAIYGVARGVLFDPLPYAHEREVGVFWKKTDWTEEEFLHLRGRTPGFRDVALYRSRDVIMRDGDAPARLLPGVSASAELFSVLGATPALGRLFRDGDDADGAEPVVVLSYALWQELGGDSAIVESRLVLDGRPRTVVGVTRRDFWFPDPSVRIWTPEPLSSEARNWNSTLIGRVAPGQDVRAMTAPVAAIVAMLDERFDYPEQWDKTRNAHVTPIRDDIVGAMEPALYATLGAMGLILLIACANVGALMLSQLNARSTELAVRLALGANRARLVSQLVAEAVLVAFASGVTGAIIAWGGFRVLARALPLGAWAQTTAPDWTVFAAALAIALVAALLVVLVPAASLWRGDLRPALRSARSGQFDPRAGRLESGLVVAEVALAVLIACGAGLLARSVANLYALDSGVRAEGVGVVEVMLGSGQRASLDALTASLAALPGVRNAAIAQRLPLSGGGYNAPLSIEGRPDTDGRSSEYRIVTPGYFDVMGIPLLTGRTIAETDRGDTERVVVVNDAFVKTYFNGTEPIGQRISDGVDGDARLIGVVADAAERRLSDEAVPVRYVAIAQMPWVDPRQSLVFQTEPGRDPAALLDEARRVVERVAPGVAVSTTTTMSRRVDTAVGPARQVMSLLAILCALALTLGGAGIYGVIAHFAARRRRDFAIRIALGLPGSRAATQVVSRALLLVAAGIGLGVIAASALARLLSSLLYGVRAMDPVAFGGAALALLAVGMLAAFIPAWRAARTDPAIVLRDQ